MWSLRFLVVACLALCTTTLLAQAPERSLPAAGATVRGVVRDSVAHAPLAGALIQLVSAEGGATSARTAVTDAQGRYAIDGVPNGRYTIGFIHPVLDSLGVEPMLHRVRVRGRREVRMNLSSPSPAQLRAAICAMPPSAGAATGAGAVVVGVVRDARDGAPLAGIPVLGEWLELTFRKRGVDALQVRLEATTAKNGWFFLCGVPNGGTMQLSASNGADSTAVLEVPLPKSGYVRRELYVGASHVVGATNAPEPKDSLAPPRRIVRGGDGRLSGTVVSAIDGHPLAGARVRLADGPETRTDDRGAWTLAQAPAGTRTLEVRAIGFYPTQRAVDVIAGAAPVRVALNTMAAMLDTVRITAARIADRSHGEFEKRRQRGLGRFLTADYLAKQNITFLSDVFRRLPGVRTDVGDGFHRPILVRATFKGWCRPDIYLDGIPLLYFSADDLDQGVPAGKVMGIEIHTYPDVPWQYQRSFGTCGVILIWTK